MNQILEAIQEERELQLRRYPDQNDGWDPLMVSTKLGYLQGKFSEAILKGGTTPTIRRRLVALAAACVGGLQALDAPPVEDLRGHQAVQAIRDLDDEPTLQPLRSI